MKLYTSYYANFKNIPKDIFCVGISRVCPEWMKELAPSNFVYYKYNFLAPSEDLLARIKAGEITEDTYKREYIKALFDNLHKTGYTDFPTWVDAVKEQYHNWKGVAFLCYEKPSDFCHRHLFRRLLNNVYHISCEEYGVSEDKTWGNINVSKNSDGSIPLF